MEHVPTWSPCWLVGKRHVITAELTKMLSLLVIISVLWQNVCFKKMGMKSSSSCCSSKDWGRSAASAGEAASSYRVSSHECCQDPDTGQNPWNVPTPQEARSQACRTTKGAALFRGCLDASVCPRMLLPAGDVGLHCSWSLSLLHFSLDSSQVGNIYPPVADFLQQGVVLPSEDCKAVDLVWKQGLQEALKGNKAKMLISYTAASEAALNQPAPGMHGRRGSGEGQAQLCCPQAAEALCHCGKVTMAQAGQWKPLVPCCEASAPGWALTSSLCSARSAHPEAEPPGSSAAGGRRRRGNTSPLHRKKQGQLAEGWEAVM